MLLLEELLNVDIFIAGFADYVEFNLVKNAKYVINKSILKK